jgi:beta-glucosidase
LNTGNGLRFSCNNALNATAPTAFLTKMHSAVDTIRIGKTGFAPAEIAISSYDENLQVVTLESVDIEGQVTSIFEAMSGDERRAQCGMGTFPSDVVAIVNKRLGSVFGGGGAFSGYNPSSAADFMDDVQNLMVSNTPRKVPILLAYDGVHGQDAMRGGTIFPHNMGLGAIQDSNLVMNAFRVAAMEMRGTGCNWTFAPCVAVVRDDRWGRSYEGFSESPELSARMVRWAVLGLQTSDLSHPWNVAACTKHFAGDGGTIDGVNEGRTAGDDNSAAPIHLTPYLSAVAAGTATIMPSFSTWADGVTMHGNSKLMTGWLKQGYTVGGMAGPHFEGFIVGDYEAHNRAGGITQSMNAGLDVPMAPSLGVNVVNSIASGSRTDDACKRVLRVKAWMNLMNQYSVDRRLTDLVGCAEHRAVARASVRASLVLLKNQNSALPIPKDASVHLCGPGANNVGLQCGGWTISWQGSSGNPTAGTTILQGAQAIANAAGGTITNSNDGAIVGNAQYMVACLTEEPYAEKSFGHISLTTSPASAGNANTINNIKSAHAAGKTVIVVVMAGRILDLSPIVNDCDAIIWASLPGTEGDGISDMLYRDKPEYNFTGKLPFTWPIDLSQEPINEGDGKTGRYAFGFGLSY